MGLPVGVDAGEAGDDVGVDLVAAEGQSRRDGPRELEVLGDGHVEAEGLVRRLVEPREDRHAVWHGCPTVRPGRGRFRAEVMGEVVRAGRAQVKPLYLTISGRKVLAVENWSTPSVQ